MKLNPKVTGGLAWAGLILILAVPSADMLTKPQGGGSASVVTSDVDAIRTASVNSPAKPVKPATTTRSVGADPADKFGEDELPSYIVGAPATKDPATTMKLTVPGSAPAGSTSTNSASTAARPTVAPNPHPLPTWRLASLGGGGSPATEAVPSLPATPAPSTNIAGVPAPTAPTVTAPAATGGSPLIIDEDLVARREAAVDRVLGGDIAPVAPDDSDFVDSDELEEWDSGSLADYLERKGLLAEGQSRQVIVDDDDEGFWLDGRDDDRRLVRRVERRRDFIFF
jgi:hypothetical protein